MLVLTVLEALLQRTVIDRSQSELTYPVLVWHRTVQRPVIIHGVLLLRP